MTVALECLLQRPALLRRSGRPCPTFAAELTDWMADRGWVPGGPEGYHFDPAAAEVVLGRKPLAVVETEEALGKVVLEELEARADPTRRWRASAGKWQAAPQPARCAV